MSNSFKLCPTHFSKGANPPLRPSICGPDKISVFESNTLVKMIYGSAFTRGIIQGRWLIDIES